jgi:hypothetical protein
MQASRFSRVVWSWLAFVVLGAIVVGCGSLPPPFGPQPTRVVQPAASTPIPSPVVAGSPAATNTPVMPPTPVIPTAAPTIPPTPLPNLSGVKLTVKDLPAGFQDAAADNLKKSGLTEEALGNAFKGIGAQARVQNLVAFQHSSRAQVALGFLIFPLTAEEKTALETQLANSDSALKAWGNALVGPAGVSSAKPLTGVDKFGDKSVGLTTMMTMMGVLVRADSVMIVRGGAVAVVMSFFPNAVPPALNTADLAKLLDTRLATALTGK